MVSRLRVEYFNGHSARALPAEIWLEQGELHLQAQGEAHSPRYPQQAVRWPERQRHGQRQAQLPDGSLLSTKDAAAWDDWARASGLAEPGIVRWMQSWRHVGAALILLVALLIGLWRWGVPAVAEASAKALPPEIEQRLGSEAMAWLDQQWLKPSQLSPAQRRQIEAGFAAMVASSGEAMPSYQLAFRQAPKALGPNAFALPGGQIVMTDALVELMTDQPDAVLGVLAHELGHVRYRHGMRQLVQASVVSTVAGLIIGDFSAVLAGVPALLAEMDYSRGFEREADEQARRMLVKAGIPPAVMAVFFERIAKENQAKGREGALPIAFSSHPADQERIAFFRNP